MISGPFSASGTKEWHVLGFTVRGEPAPQGSMKVLPGRGRRRFPVLKPDNPRTTSWKARVSAEARIAAKGQVFAPAEALSVVLTFHLGRGDYVRRRHPSVKPDLDKLVRAVFDALTNAKVWKDDGQVVRVSASKHYAGPAGGDDGPRVDVFVVAYA